MSVWRTRSGKRPLCSAGSRPGRCSGSLLEARYLRSQAFGAFLFLQALFGPLPQPVSSNIIRSARSR